jgi:hypothetical protein
MTWLEGLNSFAGFGTAMLVLGVTILFKAEQE